MVDRVLLATKIAAIRDAVARIRSVLPADPDLFISDRTTREVVVLNLFVALQESMSLAAHWVADQRLDVPRTYAEVFSRLGEHATGELQALVAERVNRVPGLQPFPDRHRVNSLRSYV